LPPPPKVRGAATRAGSRGARFQYGVPDVRQLTRSIRRGWPLGTIRHS
jgi:hypothetical protein